jgi:hypothetical protein
MPTAIKLQVLAVGEMVTGTSQAGRKWARRPLQIFVDQIAGNHPLYGTEEELKDIPAGMYMADLTPQAADRGAVEFVLSNLKPVKPNQQSQNA